MCVSVRERCVYRPETEVDSPFLPFDGGGLGQTWKEGSRQLLLERTPPPPQQMPHTLGSFSGGEVRIKTNFFCSRGNTVLSLDESNFHSFDVSALFPLQTNTITKSIVHSRLETRWTFKNIYTTNVLTFSSELYVGPHIFGGSCRRTTNDEPDISFFFLCRDNNSTF